MLTWELAGLVRRPPLDWLGQTLTRHHPALVSVCLAVWKAGDGGRRAVWREGGRVLGGAGDGGTGGLSWGGGLR